MAGIGKAIKGLGLLGKKLRKEPWVKSNLKRGTHPGWIKDRAKELAEMKADRILKKKNIFRRSNISSNEIRALLYSSSTVIRLTIYRASYI